MEYELHPACAAWPQMADDALDELTADIKANGLRDAITLTPDGKLLDGRNREIACKRLGIETPTVVHDGDPVAFSISRNKNRRHMDKKDIAFVAQALENVKWGGDRKSEEFKMVNAILKSDTKTRADLAKEFGIDARDIADVSAIREKGTAEVIRLVQDKKNLGLRAVGDYVRRTPKSEQVADPAVIRRKGSSKLPREDAKRVLRSSPKSEDVRDAVRPYIDADKPVPRAKLAEKLEVSEETVIRQDYYLRGHKDGAQEATDAAPIDPSALSQTAQEKFATLERRLRAQIDTEVSRRVQEGIRRHIDNYLMPQYREKLADADRVLSWNRGKLPFSNQEYRLLMAALHTDCNDDSLRMRVFNWVTEREIILRKVEKDEKKLSSDLPANLAELMARREQVKQERAAAARSRAVSRK